MAVRFSFASLLFGLASIGIAGNAYGVSITANFSARVTELNDPTLFGPSTQVGSIVDVSYTFSDVPAEISAVCGALINPPGTCYDFLGLSAPLQFIPLGLAESSITDAEGISVVSVFPSVLLIGNNAIFGPNFSEIPEQEPSDFFVFGSLSQTSPTGHYMRFALWDTTGTRLGSEAYYVETSLDGWNGSDVEILSGGLTQATFVLIPEPSTTFLLALGITGIAARQRHHRRGTRTTRRV